MTKLVKLRDAKANLSQLIREAEAGETIIVTRHGKPTVRLAVVEPETETGPVRMAVEAFRNIPKIEDLEFERDRTPWGEIDLDFGRCRISWTPISSVKRPGSVPTPARLRPLAETYLSAITAGEMEYGVERMSDPTRRAQLRAWADGLLEKDYAGRILPVTGEVMATWAQLVLRSGRTPGQLPRMDSLLAATALHHRLTLVTRNTADFQALGVPFLNPWEG